MRRAAQGQHEKALDMLLRSVQWKAAFRGVLGVAPSGQVAVTSAAAQSTRRRLHAITEDRAPLPDGVQRLQSVESSTEHLTVRFGDGESLRYRKLTRIQPSHATTFVLARARLPVWACDIACRTFSARTLRITVVPVAKIFTAIVLIHTSQIGSGCGTTTHPRGLPTGKRYTRQHFSLTTK